MSSETYLVVNADDFGHGPEVNAGVIEAHERGIVTSTSLMTQRAAAADAAAYARAHPALAVGLHVELGEWTLDGDEWVSDDAVPHDRIEAAVRAQLASFRELVGADPTHVDSHQHAHRAEPAKIVLQRVAAELGVPLRLFDPRIRYVGRFYGEDETGAPLPDFVTAAALVGLIRSLEPGWTEISCHPARGRPADTSYAEMRERELVALCDPEVRAALDMSGIRLRTFRDLAA
jgi:predicted glycoside hydrolase/deacetylase ChbG (UPF0249 family)